MAVLPLLFLLSAVVVLDAQANCPEGWEPANAFDSWKCVMSMDEFDNDRECIRAGGIPGVIMDLSRDKNGASGSSSRKCIKDLKNGDFGFARNLRTVLKALKAEEEARIREMEQEMEA